VGAGGDVRGKLNEQSKPVITIWSRDLLALSASLYYPHVAIYHSAFKLRPRRLNEKSLQENYSKERRRRGGGTEGKETNGERVMGIKCNNGGGMVWKGIIERSKSGRKEIHGGGGWHMDAGGEGEGGGEG
jgi:hypothetical protein